MVIDVKSQWLVWDPDENCTSGVYQFTIAYPICFPSFSPAFSRWKPDPSASLGGPDCFLVVHLSHLERSFQGDSLILPRPGASTSLGGVRHGKNCFKKNTEIPGKSKHWMPRLLLFVVLRLFFCFGTGGFNPSEKYVWITWDHSLNMFKRPTTYKYCTWYPHDIPMLDG